MSLRWRLLSGNKLLLDIVYLIDSRAFDNIRTVMPINSSDDVGTQGDGLVRSQSVEAIYPGPGSWNGRHFPGIPAVPTT